jgi:hypothetical protein
VIERVIKTQWLQTETNRTKGGKYRREKKESDADLKESDMCLVFQGCSYICIGEQLK